MLAAEFPDQGRAGWMKRVEAVLKGASFAEKLVRTTADGIRLEPLHGQQACPMRRCGCMRKPPGG